MSEQTIDQQIQDIVARMRDQQDAEPTGRLLPDFLRDGEEWSERAVLDGRQIRVTYYFDADEIAEYQGGDNPPEYYPWDAEHVVHITDDEHRTIVTRGFAGFEA